MLTELQVDGGWEGLQPGYRAIAESTTGSRSVSVPSGVPGLWQRGRELSHRSLQCPWPGTSSMCLLTEPCLDVTLLGSPCITEVCW